MTSSFYRPPIKDITITSSIGRKSSSLFYEQTVPIQSSDLESFPIEAISSSTAGVFPDLNGSISSSNYIINITQSWSSSFLGPEGYVSFINDDQKEFYNGELSGSNIIVTEQRLIDEECVAFLQVNTTESYYKYKFYFSTASVNSPNWNLSFPPSSFLIPSVSPNSGEIYICWSNVNNVLPIISPNGKVITATGVTYIKVNKIDADNSNNSRVLELLKQIRIKFNNPVGSGNPNPSWASTTDTVVYNILGVKEYLNYYLNFLKY